MTFTTRVLSIVENVLKIYATPMTPREYGRLFSAKIGSYDIRGTVIHSQPTPDKLAVELTIQPSFGFRNDFQAGQYVGLGVNIRGQWRWRSYSLTSAPHSHGKYITFFIRRNTDGEVSNHIIDALHPGDIVRLSHPQGQFILPSPPPEKILFITSGSGITPVIAMIRSLFKDQNYTGDVVHIHSERSLENLPFTEELRSIAANNSNYSLNLVETSTNGRINFEQDLSKIVPDWEERITWACGNNDMLKTLQNIYTAHKVSDKIFTEKFSIDRAIFSDKGGTVTVKSRDKSFECQPGESILLAAEKSNVNLPSGCRIGICHTCMLLLDEGNTIDMESGEMGEAGQKIRTCTSTALGEVYLV